MSTRWTFRNASGPPQGRSALCSLFEVLRCQLYRGAELHLQPKQPERTGTAESAALSRDEAKSVTPKGSICAASGFVRSDFPCPRAERSTAPDWRIWHLGPPPRPKSRRRRRSTAADTGSGLDFPHTLVCAHPSADSHIQAICIRLTDGDACQWNCPRSGCPTAYT